MTDDDGWAKRMKCWYWYETCPICQETVQVYKPHDYRLWIRVPLCWDVIEKDIIGFRQDALGKKLICFSHPTDEEEVWNRVKDSYPFRPYMFRFGGNLVHKKCIENVQGGPSSSFALLLNLVGATFFAPPRSHSDVTCDPILPRGFTPTPDPQVTQSPNGVPFEKTTTKFAK